MKATHTPGPWIYKATAGNHDFAVYPESTGRDVALVRGFDNEANARLIAKAPELADALRRLADRMEQIVLPDGSTPETAEARGLLAEIDGGDQ